MIVHPVFYKLIAVIKMHEWIAFQLLCHGGGGALCIIMSRVDDGCGRQVRAHILQGDIHLLRITALQVTAPAAIDKQGIAGNQVITDVITGRSRCVPGCMQRPDRGFTELNAVAAMMQGRQIKPLPSEFRFILEQV